MTIKEEPTSSITIIPLGTSHMNGPYLTDELEQKIRETLDNKKKVVCIYNRRGSAHSYVCNDCGYQEMCPHCNISLSYHTSPEKHLICHQCNYISSIFITCPKCSGNSITPMGIGIQRIELTLESVFQKARVIRVDSDAKKAEKQKLLDEIDHADIILGTQMVLTTLHEDIGLIAFLLIDNDLAIPEFDREEKIYTQIVYASRMRVPTIIQTYASESPFIEGLLHGNYKDFLQRTLSERETFLYPPYGSFITLWVHHQSQDMVRDIIHKLVNKMQLLKTTDIFLSYDRDIWEKYAGNWKQKIVLKGKNLEPLIAELHTEILRNRQVYIERH